MNQKLCRICKITRKNLIIVGLPPSKKNCFICFNENRLRISSQKLFSFSRYFNFCLDFLVMLRKRFNQKDQVKFKIYDVHNLVNPLLRNVVRFLKCVWPFYNIANKGLTNNYNTHIRYLYQYTYHMSNISRSKGNQGTKFGRVIEYNQRNIFSSKIMQKIKQGDQ